MANDKQKRADELDDARRKKQDAANARRTGKYSDKLLYSPLDNSKTWDNAQRPGMRTTRT